MPGGAGRFAPSPSGRLHLGNLRTALLAWLAARSTGRRFLVRMEDLDRVQPGADLTQLGDLAALGLDWDGEVVYQSRRRARYDEAIESLTRRGLTYPCFCSRREMRAAASAPHARPGIYPGTCRGLTDRDRAERTAAGRPAALRLRAEVNELTVVDQRHGDYTGPVDDVVLRRTDGVPAYNLTVVVDDAEQGVDQVVRAEDLLESTPRQVYLAQLLGLAVPAYLHVPLAVNVRGDRLAKRDGAVTLDALADHGHSPADVLGLIAASLGLTSPDGRVDPAGLLEGFHPSAIPPRPWVVDPETLKR